MIEQYTGTIGSGKSYHALEKIVEALSKGKYVISNFPLTFSDGQIRRGYAERYMYIPDDHLMGSEGVIRLFKISMEYFYHNEKESQCLVVIDESGNYFSPLDTGKPEQRLWEKFFTLSRKLGYDFLLISQTDKQVNKTIRACVEYEVKHRKANRVFPFKYLPFTIFMYITYWKQTKERLGSESSIFVKRFSSMFNTMKLFGCIDEEIDSFMKLNSERLSIDFSFGNCIDVPVEEKPTDEIEKVG